MVNFVMYVFPQNEKRERDRDFTQRSSCEAGGRDQRDVATSQGTLEPPGGTALRYLDFSPAVLTMGFGAQNWRERSPLRQPRDTGMHRISGGQ